MNRVVRELATKSGAIVRIVKEQSLNQRTIKSVAGYIRSQQRERDLIASGLAQLQSRR